MSAICGIFNLDGRPVSEEVIDSMMAAMDYWGPDGSGVWRDGPVAMGHLMLHNTPESLGDRLPRTSASGDLVITAHARIDNRNELFESLRIPHNERAGTPDSALILMAYEKWGQECPDRLVGDWCFAIWNIRRRTLFLARDHHGNTGVYYYRNSRFFAFSSCLKGLFALPDTPFEPNPLHIAQMLLKWPEHGESTCYKDIKRLPPAHQITVTTDKYTKKRYWYLENTPPLSLDSDQKYVEVFMEIFTEAVRCRMRSVRPVGVTLSGGIDSASVAVIAARDLKHAGKRLPAFSSVPLYDVEELTAPSHFGDERPFVEATSRHAGNIDVHFIRAEDVSPVQGIKRAIDIREEPGLAAANQYWIHSLLETARAQGIGGLLTGQGGNTTISWHSAGHLAALARKGEWLLLWHELIALRDLRKKPLWRLIAGQVVKPLLPPLLLNKYRSLKAGDEPWARYSVINMEFARELAITKRMRKSWHDPTFSAIADPWKKRLNVIKPGRSIIGSLWQEIGAGYGLEVLDPTLDKRLMEFCLSIPDNQYFRNGRERWLIRRAMKGLIPQSVLFNSRKGRQAADIGIRLMKTFDETLAVFREIERSELARQYLNIPLMRNLLDQVCNPITQQITRQIASIFLRGLMVGLFLIRFDGRNTYRLQVE
jgi:asparagine synthase (glutamine-hydrolysing)